MSGKPWYPMYWKDFMADTAELSNDELGAYVRLLGHYYIKGEPLPDNDARLRRIAGMTKYKFENFREIFSRYFSKQGENFHHKRADKEIAKASDLSEKRAMAGKKGGLAKAQSNAKQLPTQPQLHREKDLKTRADTRAFQILKSKFGDKKGGSLAAALLRAHTGPQVLEILKRSEGKSDEYAWLRACCKLRLPDDPILLWQVQKAVGLSEEYPDLETQQAGIMAHIAADKVLTAKAQAVLR